MRNGDIMRLRRDNFVERDGRVFLNYTPRKTEHSSGRVVKWPVHPSIWAQMRTLFNGDDLPELDEAVFDELNAAMRGVGKALYNKLDNVEIFGMYDGYRGLIDGDYLFMDLKSFSGIDLAISKALKEKKNFNEGRFVGWSTAPMPKAA